MHRLTDADHGGAHVYSQRPLTLDFIRIERDRALIKKARFLPPKPRIVEPAAPARLELPAQPGPLLPARPDVQALSYRPAIDGVFNAIGFIRTRDAAPLVRVRPVYPPDAERRGIEGWVKAVFTIAEDGGVIEPRVVDAEPDRVFDRAALRAISKWRYQPQVIDGQAIRRTGVEVIIEFKLQ